MTQWILSGVGGELDNRDRESEFAATSGLTQSELLERLESVIGRVRQVIEDTPTDQLLANRTVQGFEVTGMGAIVHSVTHFVGHTHQIIQLTRLQLGDAYRFAWSPDAGKTSLPI
jgi:actin-like ATPase involved in cell morphogenesis